MIVNVITNLFIMILYILNHFIPALNESIRIFFDFSQVFDDG